MAKLIKKYTYTVILEKELDPEFKGYYNASVPALPGCFSYGKNKKEALDNIKEAILCYIEDLKKNGEPVPEDISPYIEKVEVVL
ncbi:type II toxin-antitoxin system HicB family antitoxin [Candidatus Aerophobetes bacterium]|nr:type II toxin-antitoxin system HicB family antitoxin [Candidatus Aerophobetes bacterium]